jgi:hypothetical protein
MKLCKATGAIPWQEFCYVHQSGDGLNQRFALDKPFIYQEYRYASRPDIAIRKRWKGRDTVAPAGKILPGERLAQMFEEYDIKEFTEKFPRVVPRMRSVNPEWNERLKRYDAIQVGNFTLAVRLLRLINQLSFPRYCLKQGTFWAVYFVANGGIEGIVMPISLAQD